MSQIKAMVLLGALLLALLSLRVSRLARASDEDCCTEKGLCEGRASPDSTCCAYHSGVPKCFVDNKWQCCQQPNRNGGGTGNSWLPCPDESVVCGSDDYNYCNAADILQVACEKNLTNLQVRHKGPCRDSSRYRNSTLNWPRLSHSLRPKRAAPEAKCCGKAGLCSHNKREYCCAYRSGIPMVYHHRQWNCYNSTYDEGWLCGEEIHVCGTDHRTYCNGEAALSAACVLNDKSLKIKKAGGCIAEPLACGAKRSSI